MYINLRSLFYSLNSHYPAAFCISGCKNSFARNNPKLPVDNSLCIHPFARKLFPMHYSIFISVFEIQAVNVYMKKALVLRYIILFISPKAAGIFFFLQKMTRHPRSCTDYWYFNAVTVTYRNLQLLVY